MPTGRNGEKDWRRVLTRKKGDPRKAPRIPDEAPEAMLTGKDCIALTLGSCVFKGERVRTSEFRVVRMGS